MCKDQTATMGVSSLLLQNGFCRSSSGCQAGQKHIYQLSHLTSPFHFFMVLTTLRSIGLVFCGNASVGIALLFFPELNQAYVVYAGSSSRWGAIPISSIMGDTLTMCLTTWPRSHLLGFLFFKVTLFPALRECHNLEENYKV